MPSIQKPSASVDAASFTNLNMEAFPAATSPAGADAWEDWDVSGEVGARVAVCFIEMSEIGNGARSMGVRTNGSAVERRITIQALGEMLWVATTDSAGVLERYVQTTAANGTFRIIGFF